MIDVINNQGAIYFKIGPHERVVEPEDARAMGALLREKTVEEIADFAKEWSAGPWRIEGAKDDVDPDNQKSETRRRLLLRHGANKWHILRKEAVVIGGLFRTSMP
jgi:hypothetical protein